MKRISSQAPSAWLFLSLSLFLTTSRAAAAPPSLDELARAPQWLRLLHMRPGWLGSALGGALKSTPKSTIDEPTFFLAPDGKHDARAELDATLAALRDPSRLVTRLPQPARCAFPARYEWLREQLGEALPDPACADYRTWRAGLAATSATLVYSSAYPNNPASMFGHTLLRLNRAASTQAPDGGIAGASSRRNELLDYGINYAAGGDISGAFYALKGLFGVYPGEYSLAPYYIKVNEYVTSESRDLWEYDLAIEGPALDRMLAHLWELYVSGGSDYWFVDENCSYQVLALLEVARPDWTLMDKLKIFTLPSDTLRIVAAQPGAVRGVRRRPAARKQMLASRRRLPPVERELYERVVRDEAPASAVQSRETIEAVIDWLNYIKHRDAEAAPERGKRQLREALLRRAQMGVSTTAPITIPDERRPDLGHDSSAWDLGVLSQPGLATATTLGLRPALHDLHDVSDGYEAGSRITILDTRASLRPAKPYFRLEQLTLVDVTSLYMLDPLEPQHSWAAGATIRRLRDLPGDESPLALTATVGGGLAYAPPSWAWTTYVLAQASMQGSSAFAHSMRVEPGLLAGLILREGSLGVTHLEASGAYEIGGPSGRRHHERVGLIQSLALGAHWQLRTELSHDFRQLDGAHDPSDALLALRKFF